MKTNSQNGIISLSLFLLLFPILSIPVGAQTVRGTPGTNLYPYSRFTSSLVIILSVLITSVCFMIFFFIYIRYCSYSTVAVPIGRSHRAAAAAAARGLDSSVIETFPTFSYSEVKDHKLGKGVLECAVCLNEFEDDETLRLIPRCDHVFHPECIDAWLESHVTCPVCRADLVPQPRDEPVRVPDLAIVNEEIHDDGNSRNYDIVIEVGNENQQQELKRMNRNLSFQYPNRPPKGPMNRNLSFQYPNRPPKVPMNRNLSPEYLNRTPVVGVNRVNRNLSFGKLNRPHRSWSMRPRMFGRSYSMGNMLVQPGEDIERFTLRLPSKVRKEVVNRALLNRTRSFATISTSVEGTSRKGYESEPIERSNQEVKSNRWVFFTRALSMTMRSPKAVIHTGESSASTSKGSGSKTLGKLRSFNCLEPRTSHETGLFLDEPARSSD